MRLPEIGDIYVNSQGGRREVVEVTEERIVIEIVGAEVDDTLRSSLWDRRFRMTPKELNQRYTPDRISKTPLYKALNG